MGGFGLVFRNAGFLFVSDVITRLLSFVLFLFIARVLGQNGLGNYSFIFAFAGLSVIISDIGVSTFFLRETSRKIDRIPYYLKKRFIHETVFLVYSLGW